jgi:hypothetical protein
MGWGRGGGGSGDGGGDDMDDDVDGAGRAMKSIEEMWGTRMAERSR